jgi:hypothetical protein
MYINIPIKDTIKIIEGRLNNNQISTEHKK